MEFIVYSKYTIYVGDLGFYCIKLPHLVIRKKRDIPGDIPFHDVTPGERVTQEETLMTQQTDEGCTSEGKAGSNAMTKSGREDLICGTKS